MTPKNRERAYEKRRYEEWQERLSAKQAQQQQTRRTAIVVGSAVLAVAVIGGAFLVSTRGDDDSGATAAPAATPSAAAQPSAEPSAAPSASAASDAKNPCPDPKTAQNPSPKQFAKAPDPKSVEGKTYKVTFETSCGAVTAELDGDKAPQAVASTVFLSEEGFYNNTPCHRLVTEGIYVLQCGDPTGTGSGGPGYSYGPIENEPKDVTYPAGTIAMARAQSPDSHGSQFFIVYKDSTIGQPGNAYTVLGKITKGLDVVEKVAEGGVAGGPDGPPSRPISILSTKVSAG